MQKKPKSAATSENPIHDEDSAFEIIELAVDDINILTKAFQVINTICEELSVVESEPEDAEVLHGIPDHMMH